MMERSLTQQLVQRISMGNGMHLRSLEQALAELSTEEASELEDYLQFCISEDVSLDRLAQAYRTITDDTLREQIHFRRNGRYRHSTFEDVASSVYFDPEYMLLYMYGLALTLYLWPNHLEIVRYFRGAITDVRGSAYLEIGPGHGAFFRQAVALGGFQSYLGVDISPTSLDLTQRLLSRQGALPDKRDWQLMLSDFLEFGSDGRRFDAVVMGEVLEHVERPEAFLVRIREVCRPGAFIFVTTAVNAPAVDHIYLFRSVEEVTSMAAKAGLRVVDVLAVPYKGLSMQETTTQQLPINVAMILSPDAAPAGA